MNLTFLIDMLTKRELYLSQLLSISQLSGDIDSFNKYNEELSEIQLTLGKLKSISE